MKQGLRLSIARRDYEKRNREQFFSIVLHIELKQDRFEAFFKTNRSKYSNIEWNSFQKKEWWRKGRVNVGLTQIIWGQVCTNRQRVRQTDIYIFNQLNTLFPLYKNKRTEICNFECKSNHHLSAQGFKKLLYSVFGGLIDQMNLFCEWMDTCIGVSKNLNYWTALWPILFEL